MNKTILKILITSLILLIGISAVSAIDDNSTDGVLSVEQTDEISAIDNNDAVISVSENNDEILSAEDISENNSEILSAEDNDAVISVSENNSEILNMESSDTVISISNDNDLTSSSPFDQNPQMTQSETQFKSIFVGKLTFLKKYKKMALYGYKIPSKKNKKAWKKHKNYQRAYKKQRKIFKKYLIKALKRAKANHWHDRGFDLQYKVTYSGKYMHIKFYEKCYRTYNYNPLLNKGWWD